MNPFVETNCTFSFQGRTFMSGGASVDANRIVAYPAANGVLQTWHGEPIGTWRSVARWRVRSCYGTHLYQIEATVQGAVYTGRGSGEGCVFIGKRKAKQ